MTSYCQNCGESKTINEIRENYCGRCSTVRNEAMQGFAAEHPNASQSDVLYAGRQALLTRAHHANRNFINPRAFTGVNGMIPVPPPGGERGFPSR